MAKSGSISTYVCALVIAIAMLPPTPARAADVYVSSAAGLQAALNAAQGGDTIFLSPGAYPGNFKLPIHGGNGFVTVRTAPDPNLPAAGTRITPAASPFLARLVSPNSTAALRTSPGASYWRLELLEVAAGAYTGATMIELGDGSSAQNLLSQVPHHLVVDRLYVHGDPLAGQKRAFGLNSGDTTIINSYVADIKAIGTDSQAVAGWNGTGPYVIQNNYLEAAGTAILFGGDDPKIPDVVPSDITFSDNTVTRPVSWRNPILPAPAGVRASFTAGSLAAGTYGYRVVARRSVGSTSVKSPASGEVSVTVAQGSTVTVQWNPVPDAVDYLVYGRTTGAPNQYWVVKGTSFNDTGAAGTSGTPSSATFWQIKNLFELKNARRVEVDHNLFRNNWAQAQSGTAILFTTRDQGGNCPWCVVEQVTFENNVVASVGGGFQVTGFDNLQPSLQGNTFRIRNNLVADLSKYWGGKAYLATITDGPRDVTFDHNTVISPDGSGIIMADGPVITGFVFTNNVARHNTYGIFGSGAAIGNKTLTTYFPSSIVTRNVMAGGSAAAYPAGNEFPTVPDFQAHFVDYAGGNYTLVPNTSWQASGTDGLDLGADMSRIAGAGVPRSGVLSTAVAPLTIDTATLPAATEGDAYSAVLAGSGGVAPITWSVIAGALPPGLLVDSSSGTIGGATVVAGDYAFTIQAKDLVGTTTSQALAIHVNRAIPPVVILTTALNTVTATVPFAQALDASGGLGTYTWAVSGALPSGLTLSPAGVLSGTTSAPGTYPIVLIASDAQDASRSAWQAYSLFVAPPPNHPPTVTLSAPVNNLVVPVGSALTIAASAADVDGNLARVDLYQSPSSGGAGTLLTSSAGPSISLSWLVAAAGTYQFTAVATDARGETVATQPVTVTTKSEIVLYASDAAKLVGNYQLVADATAAAGVRLFNPDLGAAKVVTAVAAPASYADFTFYAEAGRPYHLWIRGKAQNNYWANDSAYVQFSGVAAARIGTTNGLAFNLESASGVGVSGWGWEDNGYGLGVLGANVTFETTGVQTIRIQPREDGLSIDQIVLSPQQFLTTAPGVTKNDTTILSK